jgi:hypothetical protein
MKSNDEALPVNVPWPRYIFTLKNNFILGIYNIDKDIKILPKV